MVYLTRVRFGTRLQLLLVVAWLGTASFSSSANISAALMQGQPCRFQGPVRINWYQEKQVYPEEDIVSSLEDAYNLIRLHGVRKLIVLCVGNNMNKLSHP